MARLWLRRSLAVQIVLAVYFQLFAWFPLGSLNDQGGANNHPLIEQIRAGRATFADLLSCLAFTLPALLFWFGYVKRLRILMWMCIAGYCVWLALQIETWWVAYIFGASESWQEVYHRVFSRTLKILPSFGTHLPPDALHFIMQILLLAAIVCGVIGLTRDLVKAKKKAAV